MGSFQPNWNMDLKIIEEHFQDQKMKYSFDGYNYFFLYWEVKFCIKNVVLNHTTSKTKQK